MFTSSASAQMAKEGKISTNTVVSGSMVVLAMGKDRLQLNYEQTGLVLSKSGKGFNHYATRRCVGSLHAVKGKFNDLTGFCQVNHADGDKTFFTFKGKGALGAPGKGTWEYVGGTGKYKGIVGSGVYLTISGRSAKKGTYQSNSIETGDYKLP